MELFDVRTAPFSDWPFFGLLGLLGLGVLFELGRRRRELRANLREGRTANTMIYVAVCLAVVSINAVQIVAYRREKAEFVQALTSGRVRVIEGQITEYLRQSGNPKRMEGFRLGSDHFTFTNSQVGSAYHRLQRSGGVLHEGLKVRLFEYRGNILRVELLPSDSASQ